VGDFIRCVRQSFNEMLHDENYQVGIILAIVFVLLFLPIFNVQGHFALKMQIAMVIATIVSLPFLLMFAFALDNCYSLFKQMQRLDSWTCSGYECRNIEDAFRKICGTCARGDS
jgi:hypothetical protein